MTDRTAPAAHPIAAPIAARWSPRSYEERPVPDAALAQVLEAARWAASCVNDQPWNYIVARKEKEAEGYAKIFSCLSANNQGWAGRAPVLILGVARQNFAHNGNPNRHAAYDLGQATANLAAEAATLGLQAHQMATLVAMQGALQTTLARFSPSSIRARAETRGLLAKILPSAREATLWQAYEREFEGVAKGSDEAFMDVFAKEFRAAYERCAAEMKTKR